MNPVSEEEDTLELVAARNRGTVEGPSRQSTNELQQSSGIGNGNDAGSD
jgi:hypothetical protein